MIRELVLSPVLAELLQLPAPGPPHTAALQGGSNASAAFTASNADRHPADGTISAAGVANDGTEGPAFGYDNRDSEDGDGEQDGSWFAPSTAARLVDLFHGLAGDCDFLLPADLVE
jgi:hypothetical protein